MNLINYNGYNLQKSKKLIKKFDMAIHKSALIIIYVSLVGIIL